MFIVTNRRIHGGASGLDKFGKTPNARGPNELRLGEVVRAGSGWDVRLLPDSLSAELKREVGLPVSKPAFASQYAARKLLKRVRDAQRNVLFFVHGFNNDMEAVIERAAGFESNYDVEVVAFSWPANGGGVGGVASYRSDKQDARASVGAVNRFLDKAREYLDAFNRAQLEEVLRKAAKKYPDNPEERHRYVSRKSDEACPLSVNLCLHSMGNYLFKQLLVTDTYDGHRQLFDNVVMVAADTNNEGHEQWVDRIDCRRRVYITINEDDSALRASRIKSGEEQRARLGHYPYNLRSRRAVYVDFTDAAGVGSAHAYFEGDPIEGRRGKVFDFFKGAFNGERVESALAYDPARNLYRI